MGRVGASNSTGLRAAGGLTGAGASAPAAGEMFLAARRARSVPARTVVRVAAGADCSAAGALLAVAAAGSLVAPVAPAVPRRGGVLAGAADSAAADESVAEADDAVPASESAVSATATPVPEIRAEPTPTRTAPVPSKTRRSLMRTYLSLANWQTVPRR